jgi:histidinol dehydrogenase
MSVDANTGTTQTGSLFRAEGRIDSLPMETIEAIVSRGGDRTDAMIAGDVGAIIARVREAGDAALLDLAERFDGVRPDPLEIPRAAWDNALASLAPGVHAALEQAAASIRSFHSALVPRRIEVETTPGVRLARIPEPIERAGIYAPGGRAAYPSSILMGVIPARVAGVREVIVCSPPGPGGRPPAAVLAACAIAGADRVFAIGGAGAIAAMAYGTGSVPRVDRIAGPGNAWVTEAKRQVNGTVAIDCPAGPSEVLVVADASASAEWIAAELVAQAEHDPDAAVVLVTTDEDHLVAVPARIEQQLDAHPRAGIVRTSLARRGALLVTRDLDQAIAFSNRWAPEHLLIATDNADDVARCARNAGTIFVGRHSSVVFGDYVSGANHVLPTSGLARSFSGLDTGDFIRRVTVQRIEPHAAARLAEPTAVLADAERLPGHAFAARLRASADVAPPERRSVFHRPAYADIRVYDPARRPCDVDLSDNTNLFGVHPVARKAVDTAPDDALTRYPSVYADPLKSAFADVLGVEAGNVVTGCGSDDIIDSAVRAFCEPDDVMAFPWPTFGVVATFAHMNAVRPVPVLCADGITPDADALLSSGARILYACRPNNPTGTSCEQGLVEHLMGEFPGVVLIDEAYAEFAGGTLVDRAIASSNTVVLRTLSKAWGMAGLRIGFAVGPRAVIAEIEKSRGPYKVGRLAEHIAVTALGTGPAFALDCVARTIESRGRLVEALAQRGIDVVPSVTNFLLVRLPAYVTTESVVSRLYDHGVGVRPFPGLPVFGDCIRVTVGPWPMMERFLEAFDATIETAETR